MAIKYQVMTISQLPASKAFEGFRTEKDDQDQSLLASRWKKGAIKNNFVICWKALELRERGNGEDESLGIRSQGWAGCEVWNHRVLPW